MAHAIRPLWFLTRPQRRTLARIWQIGPLDCIQAKFNKYPEENPTIADSNRLHCEMPPLPMGPKRTG